MSWGVILDGRTGSLLYLTLYWSLLHLTLWSLLYSTLYWRRLHLTPSGAFFAGPSAGVFFTWPSMDSSLFDSLLESSSTDPLESSLLELLLKSSSLDTFGVFFAGLSAGVCFTSPSLESSTFHWRDLQCDVTKQPQKVAACVNARVYSAVSYDILVLYVAYWTSMVSNFQTGVPLWGSKGGSSRSLVTG